MSISTKIKWTTIIAVSILTTGCKEESETSIAAPFQIETLPAYIMYPGSYTIKKDLEWGDSNAPAIEVIASDVSLDFGGKKVKGIASSSTYSNGVLIHSTAQRVEIKNGTLSGFYFGTYIEEGGTDAFIQKMIYEKNHFHGILSLASRTHVANNMILNTGGTTTRDHSFSVGIQIIGSDCSIESNQIEEFYPTGDGEGLGISVSSNGTNCKVEGNSIFNSMIAPSGRTFGLWLGGNPGDSLNLSIVGNSFTGMTYAIAKTQPVDATFSDNSTFNSECSSYTGHLPSSGLSLNTFDGPIDSKAPGCTDVPGYWRPLANAGNISAMFRYAYLVNDIEEKYYWYLRAGRSGHTEAARVASKLALLYPELTQ